jgi:hypothetical protein
MSDAGFTLEGLGDLQKDLEKMQRKYPDETEKEVYRLAGVWTKDVNEKMPSYYSTGKWPIPGSWHRSRERSAFGGYTVGIEVQNTAPHWHLIENGHTTKADPAMYAAYKGGRLDHSKGGKRKAKSRSKNEKLKVLGWTPGKGYALKTREEWDGGKYAQLVQKFIDKMLKRYGL